MTLAVIAAIGAALLAGIIVVCVLISRNRKQQTHASPSHAELNQLTTVGVGTNALNAESTSQSAETDIQVGASGNANERPADNLAGRFVAVGVFSAAVFGSLAAKLWSLQVLSSSDYSSAAAENLYTSTSTPAPRGYIFDSDGIPLVKNRSCQTVLAEADVANDYDVLMRLSTVLGLPLSIVRTRVQDSSSGAQSQRVVDSDATLRNVAFIAEHADAFPGVSVETRTMREYPYGALAAHVLGYTASPSEEQLASVEDGREMLSTDTVGRSGFEYAYDTLLSGDHGERTMTVDAEGNVIDVVSETKATRGSDVRLTIKAQVQYACDYSLANLIAPQDGIIGTGQGVGGAIVVMDVRDGSIIAMSSYPTWDPNDFTPSVPDEIWSLYSETTAHGPMNNRAAMGLYAAASTFKPFTGMASLTYGFAGEGQTWACSGSWDGFNTGSPQRCWLHSGHGTLDFHGAIVNSCDIAFYEMAKDFFLASESQGGTLSDTALQDEVKKYRFGQITGLDIGGEDDGLVPTPEWKAERWSNVPANAKWQGGDYTNMIIGQGDVQVTPLQVAVAYGGIATGKIMKPHVLKEVYNADGDCVMAYEPEVVTEPDVSPVHLQTVREALHGVATENATVSALFAQYGIDAAAKTGTAEHTDKGDDAWFACYAPYSDPKYVVTCVIEEGGGGSAVAAPLGAYIMSEVLAAEGVAADTSALKYVSGSTGQQVENLDTTSSSGRTD